MSFCISGDAPWRDEHGGTNPTPLAHFYQRLLAKNVRRPHDVIMWPQMTFQREMMQQRPGDIKHSLSDYESGWVGQIWCILEVPNFFTLALRNWHDLRSPISKIRNVQIVDTHVLTVHCEFQRVRITGVPLPRCQTSKKTQLEVRSLNVSWRRDLWCHRVIVIFCKCVKLLAEQLWQIWRRYAPPFFRYLRKTWGGVDIRPRPCAG